MKMYADLTGNCKKHRIKSLCANKMRKQKDRLDAAMPSILEGYCSNSDKPREEAEAEAKEFLQILEDSASYQFGKNHSIAYCLLGYFCAYYRYHYTIEFLTSFLNNAANEEDIRKGTACATRNGITVTMPKWGLSRSEYFYDKEKRIIAKGLSSVKFMNDKIAEELYDLSKRKTYNTFMELLIDINERSSINTRQLDILIKIDFFSEFGNQRELLRIVDLFYETFKRGTAKKISKTKVDGTSIADIISKYSTGETKSGVLSKSYTILDMDSLLLACERAIKDAHMDDLSDLVKVQNFKDVMGYVGYTSGKEEDRPKLYVLDVYPLKRRSDGKQFGYSIVTKSIGSGKESRFTVFNNVYHKEPVKSGDIILCKSYLREGQYFKITSYERIF